MTTESGAKNTHERSPRFPSETLVDAIGRLEKFMTELGRGIAPAEAAAKAIGFGGLSGASRAALASLSYYGFLDKQGQGYRLSDLALRVIRPLNDSDKLLALREAHLSPKLFSEIEKEHSECSEKALANLLQHKEFTEEGAKRAAWVFKDNVKFLESSGYIDTKPKGSFSSAASGKHERPFTPNHSTEIMPKELSIPLGENLVASIPFPMSEEDFKLLIGTLNLWKNKLVTRTFVTVEAPDEIA